MMQRGTRALQLKLVKLIESRIDLQVLHVDSAIRWNARKESDRMITIASSTPIHSDRMRSTLSAFQ